MKEVNRYLNSTKPQIIVGIENCDRCKQFKKLAPSLPYYQIPDKFYGLGDVIAKITLHLNIKKCAKCKIRHYKLNKWFPFLWTDRGDRTLRNKLVKIDATIFPVVTNFSISKKYPLDSIVKDFTKKYPDPE